MVEEEVRSREAISTVELKILGKEQATTEGELYPWKKHGESDW